MANHKIYIQSEKLRNTNNKYIILYIIDTHTFTIIVISHYHHTFKKRTLKKKKKIYYGIKR